MNASWDTCRKVKENQVGSNSSLRIDRIMLFPVEIVHINIDSRTYSTASGTNNLRDIIVTKFNESNYSL